MVGEKKGESGERVDNCSVGWKRCTEGLIGTVVVGMVCVGIGGGSCGRCTQRMAAAMLSSLKNLDTRPVHIWCIQVIRFHWQQVVFTPVLSIQ